MSTLSKTSTYEMLIETGGGPMKAIGMMDTPNHQKFSGISSEPGDTLRVKYLRHLTTNEHGIAFSEFLPFTQEHDYEINRGKVIALTKASSTMSGAFTDYIHKTTSFMAERNIPYWNSDQKISVSEVN